MNITLPLINLLKTDEFIKTLTIVDHVYYCMVKFHTNKGNDYQCEATNFESFSVGLPLKSLEEVIKKIYIKSRDSFTLILLTSTGFVYSCGDNANGQCGLSEKDKFVSTLTKIKFDDVLTTLQFSGNHGLALSSTGTLYSWGRNETGQCGNGTLKNVFIPRQINSYLDEPLRKDEHIMSIQLCEDASVALTNKGRVYQWGLFKYGEKRYLSVPTLLRELLSVFKSVDERIIEIQIGSIENVVAFTNKKSVVEWQGSADFVFIHHPIVHFVRQTLDDSIFEIQPGINLIQRFIHHGFFVNQKDDNGFIALNHACFRVNSIEMIKLLLENGSHVSMKDQEHYLPLQRLISQHARIDHDLIYFVGFILQQEPSQIHSTIDSQSLLHLLLKN
mmetsp:Transcript_7118/g.10495  ORF Transcript_7118/g.10495 Transcript_7118/m.10495 type:complete len:388 (-) Transcript_7118:16-1179(-)